MCILFIYSIEKEGTKKSPTIEKPSTFKELTNTSYMTKSKNTTLNMTVEDLPNYEEKCLRNTIVLYLPKLRQLYDDYANVAAILDRVPFNSLMVRMFLWQLYRDCKLPEKGYSLIKTDNILNNMKNVVTETKHNPFEKIYFSQFLHSLISIAWDMYGESVIVEGYESILRTVLTKFLEEDIFPNARHYQGNMYCPLPLLYTLGLQCFFIINRYIASFDPQSVYDPTGLI